MQQRLFLGFAPTDSQRAYLSELQQQLICHLNPEAKAVSASNLHLTLCFMGQANNEQKIALLDAVDHLVKPRFSVRLNQLDVWPNAQVCCLKGDDIKPPLAQLAKQTQEIADRLQLHRSEHSFCPHISLFRKAKQWTLDESALLQLKGMNTLTLTPDNLHLYHSKSTSTGVEYHILDSWALGEP
ncbi:RNA 2',3'-cyclic phosphodiesterase [Shewanella sp.]|uniref:RNA 2',3'-cyclic phosphodiesterase n=1 Tax=Shewanella sp. TaxID=50422 RepID=UPI001B4BE496|nr:RNA 2',3'-cyclic phosphodiesterase [Shewanella sp.]MBP6517389.1 RNA 2',3'-cyclic phosphodiesterase [Shewanella sp.]